MKIIFLKTVFIILFFSLANSLCGQTPRFFVGFGGFAKHSFPNSDVSENTNILGYSDVTSKTLLLEPGYELTIGANITNRVDLILGINSSSSHLGSDPYNYELNFQQVNFPISVRYHYSSNEIHSNFVLLGISFGRILQRELVSHRSTWQHSYLEDWNDVSPLNLELGVGRAYTITENSNLILNPYLCMELSKNEILETFYEPFSFGLKISYEFKF